jgi:UDP-N-acetylglucosamine 2-epimerase (non-hydrolysing)
VRALVEHVTAVSPTQRVRFVVHGPTAATLRGLDLESRLKEKGVELEALQPHGAFAAQLAAAPWVITDGGSVQEECALLGVPTLLWRRRTERPDGLGANVVLSGYDDERARAFLAAPERWRRPAAPLDARPSERILAELLAA